MTVEEQYYLQRYHDVNTASHGFAVIPIQLI